MLKKLAILGLGFTGALFLALLFAVTPAAASAHDVQSVHNGHPTSTQVSYTKRTQSYTHVTISAYIHYVYSAAGQHVTVTAHAKVNYTAWTKTYFHYSQRTTIQKLSSSHHQPVQYIQMTKVSYTAWTKSYTHLSASAYVHYTYWTPGQPGHHGKKVSVTIKARVSYTSRTKTYVHYTASTQAPVTQTA